MKTKSIYIHIPFCRHKCYYCDFNTYALSGQPVDAYIDALGKEMALTVGEYYDETIESIFVGGGTPTALTATQMERFMALINHYFPNRSSQFEFTVEANPGTTEQEKLEAMKRGGVNRISFGAQTFNNELLKTIGRIHEADEIVTSVELARNCGFENISLDLMFGLPEQTLDDLQHSIEAALALALPHYSIYGLIVEQDTPFHRWYERGQLALPDEDDELAMFQRIISELKAAGYHHYEISNFAKAGFEGKHNLKYWQNENYFGIGAGAHGYVGGTRYVNVKKVQPYITACAQGLPRQEEFKVATAEAMEDFMMVGLRMLDGVAREQFQTQFDRELEDVFGLQLNKLLHTGLIERTDVGFRLTEQGLLFGNEVFAEFIN